MIIQIHFPEEPKVNWPGNINATGKDPWLIKEKLVSSI